MYKKIGMVSGMGAAAGVRVLAQLIVECQKRGAVLDSDFPEIILHNVPSRGLDETGINEMMQFKIELLQSVGLLNSCGVELIIIACNTAHILLSDLQAVSKAKILNMVSIACEGLENKKVGVISSRTMRRFAMYPIHLRQLGADAIAISDVQQDTVDRIIDNAIKGRIGAFDERDLWEIMQDLKIRGADEIIFGCTELPLVLDNGYVDPAKKTIERALTL